jgi:hypothetical protein
VLVLLSSPLLWLRTAKMMPISFVQGVNPLMVNFDDYVRTLGSGSGEVEIICAEELKDRTITFGQACYDALIQNAPSLVGLPDNTPQLNEDEATDEVQELTPGVPKEQFAEKMARVFREEGEAQRTRAFHHTSVWSTDAPFDGNGNLYIGTEVAGPSSKINRINVLETLDEMGIYSETSTGNTRRILDIEPSTWIDGAWNSTDHTSQRNSHDESLKREADRARATARENKLTNIIRRITEPTLPPGEIGDWLQQAVDEKRASLDRRSGWLYTEDPYGPGDRDETLWGYQKTQDTKSRNEKNSFTLEATEENSMQSKRKYDDFDSFRTAALKAFDLPQATEKGQIAAFQASTIPPLKSRLPEHGAAFQAPTIPPFKSRLPEPCLAVKADPPKATTASTQIEHKFFRHGIVFTCEDSAFAFLRYIFQGHYTTNDVDVDNNLLTHLELFFIGQTHEISQLKLEARGQLHTYLVTLSPHQREPPYKLVEALKFLYMHKNLEGVDLSKPHDWLVDYCVINFANHHLSENSDFTALTNTFEPLVTDMAAKNMSRNFADRGKHFFYHLFLALRKNTDR